MSDVTICNLALGHIGDKAGITSITPPDATNQAEQCAQFYPVALQAMQERFPFSWTKQREVLALVEESPNDQWAFSYALPSSHLRTLKIIAPGATNDAQPQDYITTTDPTSGVTVIYTNVDQASIEYIRLEQDAARYSALFTLALSHYLASLIAGPIIKGKNGVAVSKDQYNKFLLVLSEAKQADANQSQESYEYASHKPIWVTDR